MQNTIEIRSRYTVSVLETTTERNGFSFGGCDIYDLVAATTCGAIGGLIDIFMVGAPGEGKPLEKWADNQVDEAVKKFAKLTGWSPREGKEDSLSSAIGYLEKTFTVNYDQRHSGDINNRFKMSTKNHHFKSLSHSPDPVGLFFSLLDQFCSTSTFVSNGTIIPITTEKNELGSLKLCGHTFESKLFCGFANWLGHVMSDIAGSSGTRGQGGRGAGLAAPFYELFQFCNFGKLNVGKDKQTFADVATRVYQQGYDTRFELAMAAPVLVVDLMVKLIWALRQYFTQGIKPTESLKAKANDGLRTMLLVANGTMCILDGADAYVKSAGGANAVELFSRINYLAWIRLSMLVIRELSIRLSLERDIEAMVALNQAYKDYLADLEDLDAARFKKESEEYERFANKLSRVNTEEELNVELNSIYEELGLAKPWNGSLDDHMTNKEALLRFE